MGLFNCWYQLLCGNINHPQCLCRWGWDKTWRKKNIKKTLSKLYWDNNYSVGPCSDVASTYAYSHEKLGKQGFENFWHLKKLLFLFSMHLRMKSLSEISLYNCRKATLWIHEGCKLYKHGVSHTSIAVHKLKMNITQQSETNHSWPYDVHCPLCVKITARLAFLWICHSCTTFGSAARYWHLYVAEEYMYIIQTWLANMP